jgi:RNA polymerase sigma-70 factor (ECF subfamily)
MINEESIKICLPNLVRYSRSLNSNWSEDILQESLIKIWINRDKYDMKKDLLKWMISIMHNVFIDMCRKRKAIKMGGEVYILGLYRDIIHIPSEEINRIDRRVLREAILGSGRKIIEPFYLLVIFDLKYEKISELTEIPLGTVKSNIQRFRNWMNKNYTIEDFLL